jgi:CRP-like cAMP-binding protein
LAELAGEIVKFSAGDLLFKEGAPGGDLYFIKEGEITVFKDVEGLEVELAVLKTGEILGIMTCLTKNPRLASARAKTSVEVTLVRQKNFSKLISSIPKWVNTVIKDFILRIKTLDEIYGKTVKRLEELERENSNVELGAKLVEGLAQLGDITTDENSDSRLVNIDTCMIHLAKILNRSGPDLEKIFAAFVESGLLKSDPSSSKRMADLKVLIRLSTFEERAREYLENKNNTGSAIVFSKEESMQLLGLSEFARKTKLNMVKEVKISTKDYKSNVKLVTSYEYNRSLLLKAQEAKLINIDTGGQAESIKFTPIRLGLYLKSINCIKILENMPNVSAAADGASVNAVTESF